MTSKSEILRAVEHLQMLLRTFRRNGNDTALLAELGRYLHLETKSVPQK